MPWKSEERQIGWLWGKMVRYQNNLVLGPKITHWGSIWSFKVPNKKKHSLSWEKTHFVLQLGNVTLELLKLSGFRKKQNEEKVKSLFYINTIGRGSIFDWQYYWQRTSLVKLKIYLLFTNLRLCLCKWERGPRGISWTKDIPEASKEKVSVHSIF